MLVMFLGKQIVRSNRYGYFDSQQQAFVDVARMASCNNVCSFLYRAIYWCRLLDWYVKQFYSCYYVHVLCQSTWNQVHRGVHHIDADFHLLGGAALNACTAVYP